MPGPQLSPGGRRGPPHLRGGGGGGSAAVLSRVGVPNPQAACHRTCRPCEIPRGPSDSSRGRSPSSGAGELRVWQRPLGPAAHGQASIQTRPTISVTTTSVLTATRITTPSIRDGSLSWSPQRVDRSASEGCMPPAAYPGIASAACSSTVVMTGRSRRRGVDPPPLRGVLCHAERASGRRRDAGGTTPRP